MFKADQQNETGIGPPSPGCSELPASAHAQKNLRPSTVKDVARLAGVSTASVSRVVNGAANVSCITKAKVFAAISRLKYSPNAYAAELGRAGGVYRRHKPSKIGIE